MSVNAKLPDCSSRRPKSPDGASGVQCSDRPRLAPIAPQRAGSGSRATARDRRQELADEEIRVRS